jgi:hypothetical protein
VLLIALGLLGLVWGGITYTTKKKVIDIGPIQATHKEEHSIPIPPIAGAIAIAGGVVLLLVSNKK